MPDLAPERWPDFLIPGEARCGSTTLWGLLAQHPDVYFPAEKELHHFSSYRVEASAEKERARREEYLRHFAGAAPSQRCGEATPNISSTRMPASASVRHCRTSGCW